MSKEKKIAWVTGVNQGIGAAVMQCLKQQHIRVIGFDQSVAQISQEDQSQVYCCDISDSAYITTLCKTLLETDPPDYFIHVAGVLYLQEHENLDVSDWLNTFGVNVFAPFYFLKVLTPYFKNKREGSIVMVSSNAARVPRHNMAAYGASKAALTSFSKTVGLEMAKYGVRVNIVSPGSTATPMQYQLWKDELGESKTIQGNLEHYKVGIPLQKIAQPIEIANAVLFFISDQSSHITMHDLVIDGGATLGQ